VKKIAWINREGLLRNRVSEIQYGASVVFIHDGTKVHEGYAMKVSGPSRFAYVDVNGRYSVQLEIDGPVELEVSPGQWETIR
jgi:hypothetical protein